MLGVQVVQWRDDEISDSEQKEMLTMTVNGEIMKAALIQV
jgi:hypothetical protein